MGWLVLLVAAAAPAEHLVTSLPITTRVDGRPAPAELRWIIRRDANERGVVPHRSGWMDYGETPWLNHHLAIVTVREGVSSVRWMSSALELDGLFTEGDDVIVRSKGTLTRYVFRGWQLVRSERPPDPTFAAKRLSAKFDSGLVHLAVVGDVMIGRATAKALDSIGLDGAFDRVRPVLARADLRLGNLEGCFRENETPRGPMDLVAPQRHLQALTFLGFDALSLANNHCDRDDAAFSRTLLKGVGIAGVRDAPVTFETNGTRVAVIAVLAWPSLEATNDAVALERQVREAKAASDVVVALVHFGEEYETSPNPAQRKVADWLFSHGVTAIVGAHPHVPQAIEQPTDSTLVAWSLGNFVFDQEGYRSEAAGQTETSTVLELRLHETLGITSRTSVFRIAGRARLEPATR